jgi:streptogramin lyase
MGSPGVRWFDGVTWRGEAAPVGPTCASVVDVDRAGNVWIGAQDVIWSYEPARQKWTSYPLPETALLDYNFTYVRDLIVDNSGDIWVYLQYCGGASCDANTKLHRIHAGEWSDLFEKHEWFMPLQQLVTDASGQGWLFWDGTVYRLEGDSPKPVAAFPALGVDVSPDGKMWAVADNALWVLEP